MKLCVPLLPLGRAQCGASAHSVRMWMQQLPITTLAPPVPVTPPTRPKWFYDDQHSQERVVDLYHMFHVPHAPFFLAFASCLGRYLPCTSGRNAACGRCRTSCFLPLQWTHDVRGFTVTTAFPARTQQETIPGFQFLVSPCLLRTQPKILCTALFVGCATPFLFVHNIFHGTPNTRLSPGSAGERADKTGLSTSANSNVTRIGTHLSRQCFCLARRIASKCQGAYRSEETVHQTSVNPVFTHSAHHHLSLGVVCCEVREVQRVLAVSRISPR